MKNWLLKIIINKVLFLKKKIMSSLTKTKLFKNNLLVYEGEVSNKKKMVMVFHT